MMRDDVLIDSVGSPKTEESLICETDFEEVVVDDLIELDGWNPFGGIAAPEGYSYISKLSFICFGPSSKFFASTLVMEGKSNRTVEEKKEWSRKAHCKINKEQANIDREIGTDRGMLMQARMQCAFMAQNKDDANQHQRDIMRMMMLTKQIESTERLVELKKKMSKRMGVGGSELHSLAAINTLMDKLKRRNADLEIMMGEVRSTNPIIGNALENAAKSMELIVQQRWRE